MNKWISILALWLAFQPVALADVKISQLPTVSSPATSDEFPVNQAGTTKKVTLSQIDTFLGISTHIGDATKHRLINDAGTSTTDLFSADHILSLLSGKSDTGHAHAASDVTSGTLGVARGGTGLSGILTNQLLYGSALDTIGALNLDGSLAVSSGSLAVVDDTSTQRVTVSEDGTVTSIRAEVNFVSGPGISVSVSDNNGDNRADVTIATTSNALPTGYMAGPPVEYVSATQVKIPAGFRARSSDDTADMIASADLTCDITASGAGGVVDGTESSNQWWYVYMTEDTDTDTESCVLSTTNEAASGTITLPTDHDVKRQLPIAIRNNASSNFIPFIVAGGWPFQPFIKYTNTYLGHSNVAADTAVLSASSGATTYTDVDCTSFIPPISTIGHFNALFSRSVTSYHYVRPNGDTTDGEGFMTTSDGSIAQRTFFMKTDSSQLVEYKAGTNSVSSNLSVSGFIVNLVP